MHALAEIQRDVARAILVSEDRAAEPWILGGAIAAGDRLAIHRNTFIGTVLGALRIVYPAIEKLVGAEFFEGAARRFIAGEPPRHAWLDDYGAGFADFLAAMPEAAGLSYLGDVARLEWTIAQAASAPDAPMLDAAALSQRDPADLDALRLVAHPSLRILRLSCSADIIHRTVLGEDDEALRRVRTSEPDFALLLHRGAQGVRLRRLSPGEHEVSAAMFDGQPLGAALAAGSGLGEAEAIALLAEHIAAGRFSGIRMQQETDPCTA